MRVLVCAALLCVAGFVSADVLQGDELRAKVDKDCKEGCLVLTPDDLARLEAAVTQYVADRLNEAYEIGKREANEQCLRKI